MKAMGFGESCFRRVAAIAGATAIVVIAGIAFSKPFHSAMTAPKSVSGPEVSQPVANQELKTEAVPFAASPTVEANAQFFFGCGDGSNGYYAERPETR